MPSITTTFLDLPPQVRRRIYSYADLLRPCPLEFVRYHTSGQTLDWDPNQSPYERCLYVARAEGGNQTVYKRHDCVCPSLPVQLLLISHAVYTDVASIFYGQNKFVLRAQHPSDLTIVRNLSAAALSNITTLLIRIQPWPCPRGHDECRTYAQSCDICKIPIPPDPLTLSSTESGQLLIQEWDRLCSALASVILPKQLRLTLICDTVDIDTGNRVMKSLQRLPILKQCTIRLGRQAANEQLTTLCRKVSNLMTGMPMQDGAFPFNKLPRELRLQILEYTGLTPQDYYTDRAKQLCIEWSKLQSVTSGPFPTSCCGRCTFTLIDCSCPSAGASYCEDCTCRRIPTQIARVSQQFHSDFIEILFSRNILNFTQDPEETISFFKRLHPNALGHIQHVKFEFSDEEVEEWESLNYAIKLERLVEYMKSNLDITSLNIEVSFDAFDLANENELEGDDNRHLYGTYCQVTNILRRLDGINSIQFHLDWFVPLEPIMESAVMGKRYTCRHSENQFVKEGRSLPSLQIPHWYEPSDFSR